MNFMKWRNWFFGISLLVIVPGLISLAINGLRPSIDFTGGSLLEVQAENLVLTKESVQETVGELYEVSAVQPSGPNQYIIRGKVLTNDQKNLLITELTKQTGPLNELRFEAVGPTLGRELLIKTINAAAVVAFIITLYVWRQFKELKYGTAAVLAMLHDSLVLLGSFSLLGVWRGVEVDVLFVTALMTTLSFSIHDTIVVFDRIREVRRQQPRLSYEEVINLSVLQTLGRSINNSMTIIIMLLTLVLLGGETIRWFAVALLIGAVTGTYSSTFTAAPLLILWDDIKRAKVKK